MANYKTEGVVLKSIKLGEADKIITIYTSARGKISAVAKGIRRTKSKFGARLEPFSHVDLLLYDGRNLDIVTQVELISAFQGIREDFDKVVYGSAMLDLLDKVTHSEEKDEKFFGLLLASLEALAAPSANPPLILTAFDLKLMSFAGFRPHLSSCVICSEPISSVKKQVIFSCEWGGIVCDKCGLSDIDALSISRMTLETMGELLGRKMCDLAGMEVSEEIEKELLALTQRYAKHYLQARLKSREYLAKTAHEDVDLGLVQDLQP